MKTSLLSLIILSYCFVATAQQLEWAKSLNGPRNDQVSQIATDGNEDIILIGNAGESFDVDPSEKEHILRPYEHSNGRAYVAKYNNLGELKWAHEFGDLENRSSVRNASAIDKDNNIIFGGDYAGSVDFDPGAGEHILHRERKLNSYVVKLNAEGEFVFANSITGNGSIIINGIDTDNDNNVYVTGHFKDTADFDPTTGTLEVVSTNGWDVFVAKYTKDGDFVWVKTFWGNGDQFADDIAVKSKGNILVTGHFQEEIVLDPEPYKIERDEWGTFDGYVVEMDPEGEIITGKHIECFGEIYYTRISLGANDTMLIGASFTFDIDLDFGEGWIILNSPSYDTYRNGVYAKYTPDWEYVHHNHFVGEKSVFITDPQVNSKNEVYMMGSFTGDVRFDSIRIESQELKSMNGENVFLARFGTNGNLLCARPFGGGGKNLPFGISLLNDDEFVFAGDFQGTTDMDPTAGETLLTNNGEIGWDAALALYSACSDGIYNTSIASKPKREISAYPNPVSGFLTIDGIKEPQTYQLIDQLGRIAIDGTLQEGQNVLDLTGINPGIYFLVTQVGYKKIVVE